MPLGDHLRELRGRLFKAALGVLAGSVVGWFLYDPVLEALIRPILAVSPDARPNFGTVTSPFDLKVKISIFLGVIVSSPVWIYQLWAFITPGLTRKERRTALAFMLSAVPMFLAGVGLAWMVLPNAVRFLTEFTPEGGANFVDAQLYLGFVTRIMLAFGAAFLLPIVLVGLNFAGLLSARSMLKAWRWVTVLCFTFAAIATPTPDVTSMLLLTVPMLALFAAAIGISWLRDRGRAARAPQWDDLDDDSTTPR
jgi:sec-independent protein translocase protein TatC